MIDYVLGENPSAASVAAITLLLQQIFVFLKNWKKEEKEEKRQNAENDAKEKSRQAIADIKAVCDLVDNQLKELSKDVSSGEGDTNKRLRRMQERIYEIRDGVNDVSEIVKTGGALPKQLDEIHRDIRMVLERQAKVLVKMSIDSD